MRITRNRAYLVLAAATLIVAYLLFLTTPAPKLEFRDRAFPQGFRDLVLESASSQIDPLFGPQRPLANLASKPDAQAVCDALFRDLDSPSFGDRDGRVQIVAFLDYRCPYCKTLSAFMSKMHAANVRFIYKEWPILGESSVLAARAGLAADKQGQYLAFHTRLMNGRFIPTAAYIEQIAAELGMNPLQLRADMNSAATTLALRRTSALASALGLVGTPALVVGRTIVQGEITQRQLERLIDQELRLPPPRTC